MAFITLPGSYAELKNEISEQSQVDLDYVVQIVVSCSIASLGLIINNVPVIIGGMLIAPLMFPLRGMALALLEGHFKILFESIFSFLIGTFISLLVAYFIGRFYGFQTLEKISIEWGSEIIARTKPEITDLFIAMLAGAMAAYAKTRPNLSDTLAGTAIAVSLMPPICVVGLALVLPEGERSVYLNKAFLLFITNVLGVILSCMIFFGIVGPFSPNRWIRQSSLLLLIASIFILIIVTGLGIRITQLYEKNQLIGCINENLEDSNTFGGTHLRACF